MRWVFCTLMVLGLTSPALAGDLDALRGSETVGPATYTRWSGFYFGGQVGVGNANADFSNATEPGLAYALRATTLEQDFTPSQWPTLGIGNTSSTSYGGFFGYNTQWQDLTLGIEANINRAGFNLKALSTPIARSTPADTAGNAYDIAISSSGSVTNLDFATLRARAGYVVGNFLPYGFAGLAIGVANVSVASNIVGVEYPSGSTTVCGTTCFPISSSNSAGNNSEVLWGYTIGGGVDVALTSNIFLRAEFEFDQFRPPPGILLSVANGRLGAGLKF